MHMLHAIRRYFTSIDNATLSMDKMVLHGCAQVFVGALYPSRGVISTDDIGRSMDGGLQFRFFIYHPIVFIKSVASTVEVLSNDILKVQGYLYMYLVQLYPEVA